MKPLAAAVLALLLAGCATCHDHPTACKGAGAVMVAGAIISLSNRPSSSSPTDPCVPYHCRGSR